MKLCMFKKNEYFATIIPSLIEYSRLMSISYRYFSAFSAKYVIVFDRLMAKQ